MIRAGYSWETCDVYGSPDEASRDEAESLASDRLCEQGAASLARWGQHLSQGSNRDLDASTERKIERSLAGVVAPYSVDGRLALARDR